MTLSKEFTRLYKALNTEQQKAVDAIEGPVMVIAGPGTGKTTILTLRIANILKQTDTNPRAILALTFTESAVSAMRDKLKSIIGGDAYKVRIHTFHGFCNDIIARHPESFPRIIGSTPATEVDKVRIIESAIESTDFEYIKPYGDPHYYVRKIQSFIQDVKRDDISPEKLGKLLARDRLRFTDTPDKVHTKGKYAGKMKGEYISEEKRLNKMDEVLTVYKIYEDRLREEKLFDFEDMLLEVVRVLDVDESFRLALQEQFLYILADEHQDANYAQNALLEHLSDFHEEPNLFIVGDEKQAIFRFQGASLENFLYFTTRFPKATIVTLTSNYRSTQNILDGAHGLITSDTAHLPQEIQTLRQPLQAVRTVKEIPLEVRSFSHTDLEYAGIALQIQTLIESGTDAESIAVLYRDNRSAFPIAEALESQGVPYTIESRRDVLADTDIQKLLLFFRALDDSAHDEHMAKVLFLDFLNVPHTDVYQVLLHHRKTKIPILKILTNTAHLKKASVDDIEKLEQVGIQFLAWSRMAKNKGTLDVFESVIKESGYLTVLMGLPNSAEKIHSLGVLFDEAKRAGERYQLFTLHSFLEHIAFIETYAIPISAGDVYVPPNAVRLMTAHRSKGLEFAHVFIINARDGVWSNRRAPSGLSAPKKDDVAPVDTALDDERRLFYVALTRAKDGATISYAEKGSDGRTYSRTQFIDEIPETIRAEINMQDQEEALSVRLQKDRFFGEKKKGLSLTEHTFLRSRFLEQGLSVTAINNYLTCPWQYFFRNLVRLPEAPTLSLKYGTAVHDALRHLLDTYREKDILDKELLMERFKQSVARGTFSDSEYSTLIKKGEVALPGFFEHHKDRFQKNVLTEFDISDVFIDILPDVRILLRGKLDVVVPQSNDSVHVIDFKTGKPKSRNAIEGKTSTESGDYKRQLVFYKLLYDMHTKGRERMVTGEIIFTEPNATGAYKEETFVIEENEVRELEEQVQEVGKNIYELSFWDTECSQDVCAYCALRHFL